MKRKEAGVQYSSVCPGCRMELWVGWFRAGEPRPPGVADVGADDLARGPIRCRCGKITLALHPERPRAVLEWDGAIEPPLSVVSLIGSLRQGAG